MDGSNNDFYNASMFDFQDMRAVYCIRNGIDEDKRETTVEDLDDMYAKIKPEHMH